MRLKDETEKDEKKRKGFVSDRNKTSKTAEKTGSTCEKKQVKALTQSVLFHVSTI